MKHFVELIEKHVDFHFALAIIAILGTASSLHLQFNEANLEFDVLSGSMYSVMRSQESGLRESISLDQELGELEKSLDELKLN